MSTTSDCGVIYSSGREPYYNLNSTWYDPAGSWLDTRRKPFRYVVNTSCVTGCNRRDDVPRRGGHDYRCYGYRRSTCRSGGNPRVRTCVHNPSGGPRDYWGRPIGDSCNGNTGGHYSNEDSLCGMCCGGGGGNACAQPSGASGGCGGEGGACSQPALARSSRSLQMSGGSICGSTSGGCSGGGGACAAPVAMAYGGCGGGVTSESGCGGCERGPRSIGLRLWGEPGCTNPGIRGSGGACCAPVAAASYGSCGGQGGACSVPVAAAYGGCCDGEGLSFESGCGGCERGPRSIGLRLWGEPGCTNPAIGGAGAHGGCC